MGQKVSTLLGTSSVTNTSITHNGSSPLLTSTAIVSVIRESVIWGLIGLTGITVIKGVSVLSYAIMNGVGKWINYKYYGFGSVSLDTAKTYGEMAHAFFKELVPALQALEVANTNSKHLTMLVHPPNDPKIAKKSSNVDNATIGDESSTDN